MRRIVDDRSAGLARQDRQRAHVGHQRVVAEAHAALGHQDVGCSRRLKLGDHVLHVPRREELSFLDVHRPSGARRGEEKIGLAAEEGGDLQDVDGLGDARAMGALVHVGDHRQARLSRISAKIFQRRLESDPAAALAAKTLASSGPWSETPAAGGTAKEFAVTASFDSTADFGQRKAGGRSGPEPGKRTNRPVGLFRPLASQAAAPCGPRPAAWRRPAEPASPAHRRAREGRPPAPAGP